MKVKILGGIFAYLWGFAPVRTRLMRDVYGHLYNTHGMYMGRWVVIRTGTPASKLLKLVTLGRYDHCRLHWIRQADADRELHNHPFNYRTFILEGWYKEVYAERLIEPGLFTGARGFAVTNSRIVSKGESATGGWYHRIATVPSIGVFTLFFMGEDTGEWGFLVDGVHVTSKEFFKQRRIAADGKAL